MTFSFAGKRFNALLWAQAFGVVGALVLRLSDLFVSGNVVGVDALAGIAAVMPVTIGAMFVGKLVYCGSGYLFAKYPGEFRNDLAREGVEFTKTIAATKGRASYIGERSIGHQDPGATSFTFLLEAISTCL